MGQKALFALLLTAGDEPATLYLYLGLYFNLDLNLRFKIDLRFKIEYLFFAVAACRDAAEIRGKSGAIPAQSRYGESPNARLRYITQGPS